MYKQIRAILLPVLLAALVQSAAAAEPILEAPAKGAEVGSNYIIGPGDTLQVYVWRNPEQTVTIPVRPDGKITTPLVEDMVAVGKTPTELARDVEKVLAEYVLSPQVNVIVTQSAGTLNQIKVMGSVRSPQAIAFREGMTVLDAILAVGGLAEFAAGNRAKLIRTENGKTTEMRVRIGRLVDGDMSQNHKLRPGDVLLVPESWL